MGPPSKPQVHAESQWVLRWPVPNAQLSRGYFIKKRGRPHLGIDIRGHRGRPIFAAHPGLVIFAGRKYRGFGNLVMIEFSEKWASLYAHLDKLDVHEGDWVEAGQQIGLMGNSGRSHGVHLHFELMKDKKPIDPLTELPEIR